MSKILTVFGATGNQGGSVVQAVLRNPELARTYKLRAVTRDPTKGKALELQKQGVEVVKGDQDDLPSLREAVRGSYAVFGVTNFFESGDGNVEFEQGKAMVDAAVAENVQYFVFSSLPNATVVTGGQLTHIAHFDNKAKVEAYVKTQPIMSAFFWPAMFAQVLLGHEFGPRKQDDGTYSLAAIWAPDSKVPLIDIVADTGKCVAELLKDPQRWNHKRIYGAGGFYTPTQMAEILSKETGETVKYNQLPDEMFKGFLPEPMRDEFYEMFVLMRDWKYFGPEGKGAEAELADSHAVMAENPTTFDEFVRKNKWFQ